MIYKTIIHFLLIFYIFPSGNKATSPKNPLLLKLVNESQITEQKYKTIDVNHAELKCKHKCITPFEFKPKFLFSEIQARFIDQGDNSSLKDDEMEAPTSKFSIFNLLPDDDDEDEDNDEDEESTKNEEEEEEGETDDDDFNFFGPYEEPEGDKTEGTKEESLLKQYHRQNLRMHNLVFPLLLAYKLKFFTVIPLLLGSLVLLIGTTGVAGFFFALFAAALGIHVKTQEH